MEDYARRNMPEKGFRAEVFLRFKYFSEELPLSQKLLNFRGSHFSQNYRQLSVARYQLKDFLSMYNQFTEVCFNHCVQNFNYRHVVPEEEACANRCAEKLINVNHRLISVYMEINPLHKQAAALEASQTAEAATQATTAPPNTPLNLAGQVQAVFGPDTVVTDGSSQALDSANDVMNPVDSNLEGINTSHGTSLENSTLNTSSDSTEESAMS